MKNSAKDSDVKKVAANYVTSQVKNWNGSHKITQREIKTAIKKVEKVLLEARNG